MINKEQMDNTSSAKTGLKADYHHHIRSAYYVIMLVIMLFLVTVIVWFGASQWGMLEEINDTISQINKEVLPMVNEYTEVIDQYLPVVDEYVGYFDKYIPIIDDYITVLDPIFSKIECGVRNKKCDTKNKINKEDTNIEEYIEYIFENCPNCLPLCKDEDSVNCKPGHNFIKYIDDNPECLLIRDGADCKIQYGKNHG